MMKRVVSVVVLLAGFTVEQQPVPLVTGYVAAPQVLKSPFRYRIIKTDETPDGMEPRVFLLVETPLDVAKKATTDDLQHLWGHIEPDDCRRCGGSISWRQMYPVHR